MSSVGDRIKRLPLKREVADAQEWADVGTLYVRELGGEERLEYERKQMDGGINAKGELDRKKFVSVMKELRRGLVVTTLITEDGEPVFDSVEDLEHVSGEVVARLADQAIRISGLAGEDVEAEVGNSEGNQDAAAG